MRIERGDLIPLTYGGFLRATTPQEEKDKKGDHRLLDKSSKSSSTEENPCSSSFSFISDNSDESSSFFGTRFLDKAEEITFADCNLEVKSRWL